MTEEAFALYDRALPTFNKVLLNCLDIFGRPEEQAHLPSHEKYRLSH
jgi:hypothetical protein